MKMIKIVFPIAIVCLLCSCSADDSMSTNTKTSYYQFSDEDMLKLIPSNYYSPGETITYVNEESAILQFEVRMNEIVTRPAAKNTGTQHAANFTYDEQYIELRSTKYGKNEYMGESSFFIQQKKWPISFTGPNAEPSEESDFTVSIGLKPFSAKIPETVVDLSRKEYSMYALGTTCNGVVCVVIADPPAQVAPGVLPMLKYVYFMEGKGILGFDDAEGHKWRRR